MSAVERLRLPKGWRRELPTPYGVVAFRSPAYTAAYARLLLGFVPPPLLVKPQPVDGMLPFEEQPAASLVTLHASTLTRYAPDLVDALRAAEDAATMRMAWAVLKS